MTMELSVNALGRNVCLGMIYDNRRDKFIEDQTLWNTDVITQNTKNQILHQSSVDFTVDDTIAEKNNFLEISGSAKSSVLFDTFELTGSSSYLHDYREYSRQARVACKYSSRNLFSEFFFQEATTRNQNHPAAYSASHFVSAIDFGADVIVVFDLNVSDFRDYEVEKSKNILSFFTCNNDVPREIQNITRISSDTKFKIHGDIKLDPEPDTLEKAIEMCKDLPTLVSKNGNMKPMKVYLTPINQIWPEFTSSSKFEPITETVLTDVENNLDKLLNLKIKCNDLLEQPACTIDEKLKNTIRETQACVTCDENEFKSKLRLALQVPKSTSANESVADELIRYGNYANDQIREKAIKELANDVSVVNSFVKLVQNKPHNEGISNSGKSFNVKLPTTNSGNVSYRQKYMALRQMVDKINPDQISGDLKNIKITEDENIKEPQLDVLDDGNPGSNENTTAKYVGSELDPSTQSDENTDESDAGADLEASLLTDVNTDESDAKSELNASSLSDVNTDEDDAKSESETQPAPNHQNSSAYIICTVCGERNCAYELNRLGDQYNLIITEDKNTKKTQLDEVDVEYCERNETRTGNGSSSDLDSSSSSDEKTDEGDAGLELDATPLSDLNTDKGNVGAELDTTPLSDVNVDEDDAKSESETPPSPNHQNSSTADIICTVCGERNCAYKLNRLGNRNNLTIIENENTKKLQLEDIDDENPKTSETTTENGAGSELDSLSSSDENNDESSESETPPSPNQQSSLTEDVICTECGKRNCFVELERRGILIRYPNRNQSSCSII